MIKDNVEKRKSRFTEEDDNIITDALLYSENVSYDIVKLSKRLNRTPNCIRSRWYGKIKRKMINQAIEEMARTIKHYQ